MIEISQEKNLIHLNGSLLGFESYDSFIVQPLEQGGPYIYLQSADDERIGFLTADPFVFFKDYTFELDETSKEWLGAKSPEELFVLCIVTLKEDFRQSTINLLAPIIINMSTFSARQIVLPPQSNLMTKTPLFPRERQEGGE